MKISFPEGSSHRPAPRATLRRPPPGRGEDRRRGSRAGDFLFNNVSTHMLGGEGRGAGPRLSARRIGAVALLAVCCASAEPAAAPRSVLVAWPPEPEVRAALRYVMTELRRLSNRFRYASLTTCHRAEAAEVDGERSLFLDVEFDMLRGQPSRHNVILFKDGDGAVTSMALDEFPHVELREPPDPDV